MTSFFKKPEVPDPPDPVKMPDPDDPAIKLDQTRQMMLARRRSGRASTVLSGESGDYSGSTLGIY